MAAVLQISLFLYLLLNYENIFVKTYTYGRKLVFVQMIHRHGMHAPLELYPSDPNPIGHWWQGLMQLTQVGKYQQYALGRFLRRRYNYFITSNPLEIAVQSSGSDRCVVSAQSTIAALYAPSRKWRIVKNYAWQPIPIRYVPEENDKYFPMSPNCPAYFRERQSIIDSPEGQAFLQDNQEMFDHLSLYSGWEIRDWNRASDLFEIFQIEKAYNRIIPRWIEPYWEQLRDVTDMSYYWNYLTKTAQRLYGGPLIQLIVNRMKSKVDGFLPEKKIFLYSGYDDQIAVILQSLNIFNRKQPPFGAMLLFELYQSFDAFTLRLLYLNSTVPEFDPRVPYVLTLPGCTEFCPLDYVASYTQDLIPGDWEEECSFGN